MKMQMAQMLQRFSVLVEEPLLPTRRADLVLPSKRIVVECQASSLRVEEWDARTRDYNRAGYAVLWIWDLGRLSKDHRLFDGVTERILASAEMRTPAEIRHCHQQSYGRIYLLDGAGFVRAGHLDRAEVRESEWRESGGDSRSAQYYPKTLRTLRTRPIPEPQNPFHFKGPKFDLGHFNEPHSWWKKS